MILHSMAAELDTEYYSRAAQLSAAVWGPHVSSKGLRKFSKELHRQLEYAMDRLEYKDVVYHSQADIDAKFMEQAKEYFAKREELLKAQHLTNKKT